MIRSRGASIWAPDQESGKWQEDPPGVETDISHRDHAERIVAGTTIVVDGGQVLPEGSDLRLDPE